MILIYYSFIIIKFPSIYNTLMPIELKNLSNDFQEAYRNTVPRLKLLLHSGGLLEVPEELVVARNQFWWIRGDHQKIHWAGALSWWKTLFSSLHQVSFHNFFRSIDSKDYNNIQCEIFHLFQYNQWIKSLLHPIKWFYNLVCRSFSLHLFNSWKTSLSPF